MKPGDFQKLIWDFYKRNKRDLPWRDKSLDPYRILISEVMLQQTQVDRVVPKYLAFLIQFPTFDSLARAQLSDVLKIWQGLGYNRRAIALKRLAQIVTTEYRGRLPRNSEELQQLPGIGPYTARAICAFVWNQPEVLIETNIRRTYIHHFFPKKKNVSDTDILNLVSDHMSRVTHPRDWYYALMDYGSALVRQVPNPNRRSKQYVTQSKFEGSFRQVRGMILQHVLKNRSTSIREVSNAIGKPSVHIETALTQLESEGFLKRSGKRYLLAE